MGESFMVEARKLFMDSKHLLLSNNAAIGAITVSPHDSIFC